MTISNTTRSASYLGNGATTSFVIPFYFILNADVQVYKKLTAATTWNLLAYGTDYTLTGAGNLAGGTFVMNVAPLGTESVLVTRTVPYTQLYNLVANDTFNAETTEVGFDKLTMADQQLDGRVAAIEATLAMTPFVPSEPYVFTNNAVLALKQTITSSFAIPSGYNALGIQPTISVGVVVTIPVGSVFVTLDQGSGQGQTGGTYALLSGADNVFLNRQFYGTQSGSYITRIDPAYGNFYIGKTGSLPVDAVTGEYNCFAGDLTYASTSSSIVPLHGTATSTSTHAGNAAGVVGIAINDTAKSGAGLGAILYGGIFVVENQRFDHTSANNAGGFFQFRNRALGAANPTNGAPGAGQGYGKNISAIQIGSQGRGTTTGTSCGWQTGILFDSNGLDAIVSGNKAIGIDMRGFDPANLGPEGTAYAARLSTQIALATGTVGGGAQLAAITLSTNMLDCQLLWRDIGSFEVRNNGVMRVAFATGNTGSGGIIYANSTGATDYSKFIDVATSGNYLMSFVGSGKTSPSGGVPSNPNAIFTFIRIRIDAADVWIPGYV